MVMGSLTIQGQAQSFRLQGPKLADSLVFPTEGIWHKNAHNFPRRFLYSQSFLWPSYVGSHAYLIIRDDDFQWEYYFNIKKYKRAFTQPPKWDLDDWEWNYAVHPYMGSLSYLAYRNRQASIFESFLGAALNSVVYEYIFAGGTQQPSAQDLMVTPLAGSLLGEGLYQFKKRVLRDPSLNLFQKALITASDPFEVFYFGFNFKKMARHHYR